MLVSICDVGQNTAILVLGTSDARKIFSKSYKIVGIVFLDSGYI